MRHCWSRGLLYFCRPYGNQWKFLICNCSRGAHAFAPGHYPTKSRAIHGTLDFRTAPMTLMSDKYMTLIMRDKKLTSPALLDLITMPPYYIPPHLTYCHRNCLMGCFCDFGNYRLESAAGLTKSRCLPIATRIAASRSPKTARRSGMAFSRTPTIYEVSV